MTNTQAFTKAFSLLVKGIKAKLYKCNGIWVCEQVAEQVHCEEAK